MQFWWMCSSFKTLFLVSLVFVAVRAFSGCREPGLFFAVARGPLAAVASLIAEHRLWVRGLRNCSVWAQGGGVLL